MFYSHDFLTSKAVGLNIIWLAGTLSAASAASLRRLSKRDVTGLDLPRACDAIQHPPEPIALRLSGHLMHGAVRVYMKQADYWITDVHIAYTAFRRAILQKPGGTTTAVGVIIVGQDTSRIDIAATRATRDLATAAAATTLSAAYSMNCLDAARDIVVGEWQEGEAPGESISTGLLNGSLDDGMSFFGSSMWSLPERQRGQSVDLGLGVVTMPHEHPYTVDAGSITRRSSQVAGVQLQQREIDPLAYDFLEMDDPHQQLFAQQHGAAAQGPLLDLGLDGDLTVGNDLLQDDVPMLDDIHGFDLQEQGAFVDSDGQRCDAVNKANTERPRKRRRLCLKYDLATVLDDATVRYHRSHYSEHMQTLRASAALCRVIKESEQAACLLLPGLGPVGDEQCVRTPPVILDLWETGVHTRLQQLQKRSHQRSMSVRHPDTTLQDEEAEGGAHNGLDLPPDDAAFDMLDPWGPHQQDDRESRTSPGQPRGTLNPRASSPPEWDESGEVARGTQSSTRVELPWNRPLQLQSVPGTSGIGDVSVSPIDDTTLGLSARSFSIETPTGLRRLGRPSSLSGASTGIESGGAVGALGCARGSALAAHDSLQQQEAKTDSQALVEQDIINFLAYAKHIHSQLARQGHAMGDFASAAAAASRLQPQQPLFFSDLAPVADSSPAVAARAFHNVLALATARHMVIEQRQPYGEIQIACL